MGAAKKVKSAGPDPKATLAKSKADAQGFKCLKCMQVCHRPCCHGDCHCCHTSRCTSKQARHARVATPAPSRTCALTAATAPPLTQTFSGTTKLGGLQLHISAKHDDKKNKATFEECFGADCTAKA